MKLHVEVTQDDIDRGRGCACHCPVSLAIRRQLGHDRRGVWTGYGFLQIGQAEMRPWPQEVAAFVSAYDKSEPVKPFAFDFDSPGSAT